MIRPLLQPLRMKKQSPNALSSSSSSSSLNQMSSLSRKGRKASYFLLLGITAIVLANIGIIKPSSSTSFSLSTLFSTFQSQNFKTFSPFSFIPSPVAMTRMLTDETVLNALRNEPPLGMTHSSTFLLGIFSMDSEKEKGRRALIRRTMLAPGKDERVCSLKEYMDYARRTGSWTQRCISPYAFVVAMGGEDRPTEHDDDAPLVIDPATIPDAEDDCIYLNIKENMENGKSVSYFKFGASIAEQYSIDYVGKTDSDSLIDMPTYLNFLSNDLPARPYNRRTYGGPSWGNHDKSGIYAAGQFYFLSSDLAEYVSTIMTHEMRKELTAKRPTEDLDMGTFVFSHPRPIKFISLSQYTFWAHPRKDEESWMKDYEEGMTDYPLRGSVLPFWHLCPSYGYKKPKTVSKGK